MTFNKWVIAFLMVLLVFVGLSMLAVPKVAVSIGTQAAAQMPEEGIESESIEIDLLKMRISQLENQVRSTERRLLRVEQQLRDRP